MEPENDGFPKPVHQLYQWKDFSGEQALKNVRDACVTTICGYSLYIYTVYIYIFIIYMIPVRGSLPPPPPPPMVWSQNLRFAAFCMKTWYLQCFLHGGWLARSANLQICRISCNQCRFTRFYVKLSYIYIILNLLIYSLVNRSDICLYLIPVKLSLRVTSFPYPNSLSFFSWNVPILCCLISTFFISPYQLCCCLLEIGWPRPLPTGPTHSTGESGVSLCIYILNLSYFCFVISFDLVFNIWY